MNKDKCSICRKFGTKLFLKGQRCLTPKCSLTRRNYPPGIGGPKAKSVRRSEYGHELVEKQKAKAEYGMRERQFSRTFKKAAKDKESTGEELLRLLELRLDNVVYRLGWAASRAQARQTVLHRKIKVNNRIVNIPSMVVKPKDILTPVDKSAVNFAKITPPKWLKQDAKELKGEVLDTPKREEIESDIDVQLIIEFYSR